MNRKRIFCIILLFLIASLDLILARRIGQAHGVGAKKALLLNETEAQARLRAFTLPKEDYEAIMKREPDQEGQAQALSVYLLCQSAKEADLHRQQQLEAAQAPEQLEAATKTVQALLSDAVYFPVPEAPDKQEAGISYENSWQSERTYGGVRGHEGTDIMADVQQRGYYPVISCSSGKVEKMGWLPKGGYRIGIRSPHGVYYYYAHLAGYEEGIAEGSEVLAGQLIGYMGDTGYSEVEGTTGNFPVHLHFGMYVNNTDGEEVSYNPYYLLKILEKNKLQYEYPDWPPKG